MRRHLLLGAAAIFVVWEHVALVLWLAGPRGVTERLVHAWHTVGQDWLVLLVLSDACVFSLCALGWLWRDLGRQGMARPQRQLWLAGALVFGSPVLLVYLARRRSVHAS